MLIPHLHFSGNCAEAISLYEQAFDTKTDILFLNGNGDGSVGHAEMQIHGIRVMLNDRFGNKDKSTDCAVALIVTFDSAEKLLACYEILKPGGIVIDPPEKLTYTELGLQFIDRFGVQWGFMVAADLEQASEKLNKLTNRDVRIVHLPPATVASAYAKGTEPGPELITADMVDKFILDANLKEKYPASRHYGFNNPDEPVHGEGHGYERYITIPDDMEVPSPIVKKHFAGGIYAACTIPIGSWDEWLTLHDWVSNSSRYEFRWETIDGVCGWIEEHLNYWDWNISTDDNRQIDLMIPVKIKGVK